jgi:3-oxoacyl-[acyl-carrier-protein] synthase III
VGCLDVRAVCSGFVTAVDLARRYVGSGTYERVLVAAAEVPSHQNRFDGIAPELTCLTTDAACVAVVAAGAGSMQVLGCAARMDGGRHRLLWCEFPASRHLEDTGVVRGARLTRAAIAEGRIFPTADFDGLRAAALAGAPAVLEEALREANLDGVDALIVAHVDGRTESDLCDVLRKRAGRILDRGMLYAYSASLGCALARARDGGALAAGETVALVTAGGGASWGALVVRS